MRAMRRLGLRSERGQAMVEFALIAPLLLMIVVGIIQFGVVINYWLDMQKVANQGARWAATNTYPGCDATTNDAVPCRPSYPTLQCYLLNAKKAPAAGGGTVNANGEGFNVDVSFPNGTSNLGDPVKVTAWQNYRFMRITLLPGFDISASATMRLERAPTRYAAGTTTPAQC
jgi:Flp pilus assembly protein TadG